VNSFRFNRRVFQHNLPIADLSISKLTMPSYFHT
jgi:hypothetical protein